MKRTLPVLWFSRLTLMSRRPSDIMASVSVVTVLPLLMEADSEELDADADLSSVSC